MQRDGNQLRKPDGQCNPVRRVGYSVHAVVSDSRLGFTLIELLVVIAILSLLISILVPSLQQAMNIARTSQCVSQLRALAYWGTLYGYDNNDFLPTNGGNQGSSTDGYWYWTISNTTWYQKPPFSESYKSTGGKTFDTMFHCPQARHLFASQNDSSHWNRSSTYALNDNMGGRRNGVNGGSGLDGKPVPKMIDLDNRDKFWFADAKAVGPPPGQPSGVYFEPRHLSMGKGGLPWMWSYQNYYTYPGHLGHGSNAVYGDQHARTVPFPYDEDNPPDWWFSQ